LSTFFRLLSYLRPYKGRVVLGFVCLILATALELAPPVIWGYIVDQVVLKKLWDQLLPAAVLLTALHAGSSLLSAVRTRLLESVGQRFVYDLRNELYAKLSRQSLSWVNETRTGDLMSRLGSDVDAVQDIVINGTDQVIANFLQLAGVLAIFCVLNLTLGLATFVPIAIVGTLLALFNSRIKAIYRRVRERLGDVNAKLQDNLSGIRVIKAFAREVPEMAAFRAVTERHMAAQMEAVQVRTTFFPFVRFIASFANTIIIVFGGWLIMQGRFTLGGLVTYRGYGRYFFGPIDGLAQINDMVQRAIAAGNRLFEVLDAPESVTDAPDARELPPVQGEIRFERVSFRYRDDTPLVLDEVTFRIPAGHTAALVGESGAGKSTIFALASRFWDPTGGRVLVDGHDLREVTQASLRRQTASVQQETFLFNATVADNIRYGRPEATDDEVADAALAANAHGFIAALPEGYHTLVGERGVKLSGGQRQRVSIARAFLADPRLLFLDEATSAVEPESERIIQEAIERLMRGRTTILAAHRLSTVRNADVIFVLRYGRLVEQGSHAELMRRDGLYARMVRQQQGDESAFALTA
jgi:ABC-type multidrug transport system fused ATPase/permease subunit